MSHKTKSCHNIITLSDINPSFYMWVNIDARGHKKARKSPNIAVGPEDSGKIPGSNPPGQKVSRLLSNMDL